MKKKLISKISIIMMAFTIAAIIPISASAAYTDVPKDASYADAVSHLTSLGAVAGTGSFSPNSSLTREQYARIICAAAGLDDLAASMKNSSEFPDVPASLWSSGYINAAVAKGYITGGVDGKFHPTQAVTFLQLSSFLVRALGYTNTDLTGTWPSNYISKAYDLGLTEGISLNNDANVPRWAAALMLDRFMTTNVKAAPTSTTAQTFLESTGSFTKVIVYGDSSTDSALSKGQVLTDKGTFNNPSNIKLELGSENYLAIKNGNITKAIGQSSVLKVSVDQVTENKVTYKDGDNEKSLVLPDNITYYHNGAKITSADLAPILQRSASIVFNYNDDNTGYSFAVVFDPVYSAPEIAGSIVSSSVKLGSISFADNPTIIRDGDIVDVTGIIKNDVVYAVTDIWGANKYIVVTDKKVGGKITNVTPSKLSPKTIQINNVDYELSRDIDASKISASNIDLSTGNNIVLYLGYDGKIVNIGGFSSQDNSDYALVLSTGSTVETDKDGKKTQVYMATLLFSDGFTNTYDVTSSTVATLRGKLVKYSLVDSNTVSLEELSYNLPGDTKIIKDDRLLGDSYASDNVKIFNIVYNSNSEIVADILTWNDLPNGAVPNGKILYTNSEGVFNDVNVILTDDILNQRNQMGIIKSMSMSQSAKGYSYSYDVLIGGKDYTYGNYDSELTIGSIHMFGMASAGIDSVLQNKSPVATSTQAQAVDSKRIKINDKIYFFSNDISVYDKDANGVVSAKTIADIDTSRSYQNIYLYTTDNGAPNPKVDIVYLVE